jgi:DNA-binding NarL/FixJ family response regulator
MKDYHIVIADDHTMFREGIKKIINETPDMEVIGEACDGLELLDLLKKKRPHMVILDIAMPKLRGIEAAQEIVKLYPQIKILFLSMHKKKEYLHLALASGGKGFLLKDDTGSDLVHALNKISKGRTYISPNILKELPVDLIEIIRGNGIISRGSLTAREKEVLKLIAEGKKNKEIAELLFISIHTVHNHRKNIKRKLNIDKNAELIAYAIQQGLI